MTWTAKGESIIASQRAEDHDARFESLFREHWGRICRVLYRLVGDWDEAEDLALDAFWRLYERPPRRETNLGGWLYRVATNLGFNALRSRKRRQRYEEEAGLQFLEERDDPAWDPAEALERDQSRTQVRRALAEIKPRSAQLLILRYSGLSYAEIADAAGVKPGSVGTLLARAEAEFEDCYGRLAGPTAQEEEGNDASQ